MLILSGQACLQRLQPVSTVGASSAKEGLVGLPQQLVRHQQEFLPPTTAASTEKRVEAKKEKPAESDDDTDFHLFD